MMVLILSVGLTGCNEGEEAESTPPEEGPAYPEKPITFIVPWSAGGSSDQMARALSSIAEKHLGQPLIVVNRDGAGGTIATTEVKGADPDGYTIMLNAVGVFTAQPFMREVDYTLEDFEAIIGLSYEPIAVVVPADSDIYTADDLKAKGSVKYASSGTGGLPHLSQAGLYGALGIEADHIPEKGGAGAITALLGGHVDIIAAHPGELIPHVENGTFRFIGIFSPERFDLIPDVPTFKEMGYDLDFSVWKFILVPDGTPEEVQEVLKEKFGAMMQDPEIIKFAENTNLTLSPIPAETVIEKLTNETTETKTVIERLGLTPQ